MTWKKLLFIGTAVFFAACHLHAQTMSPDKKGPVGVSGWVTFWDEGHKSVASFEKHADQIDRVYFEWTKCGPDGLPAPVTEATEELKAEAMKVAAQNKVETWFMTGNYDVSIKTHNGAWIEKFLYDDALRAKHVRMLVDIAKKYKVAGIQIDYENIKAADKDAFTKFMQELQKAAEAKGLKTGIALPAKVDDKGTWDDPQSRDYPAIGKTVDELVPMTYDYHWATSAAGNITSPEWSEMCGKYAASVMPADKVELGYPVYGYDWVGMNGDTIVWSQFMDLIAKTKAVPVRDTDYSQELKIDYTDAAGAKHEAWMTDSYCLEAQCNVIKRNHFYGLGVWYFGAEDESFWATLKQVNSTPEETHLIPAVTGFGDSTAGSTPGGIGGLATKDLMTLKVTPDYTYAYPDGKSKVSVIDGKDNRWLDVSLQGNDWSGFGVGLSRKNLSAYVQTGALQFYVKGAKGGETSTVGFIMDKGPGSDEKYGLVTEVPLEHYVKTTDHWQWVTIPLSDFPVQGYHFDAATQSRVTGPFKWERVLEFAGNHTPTSDPNCELFFSSIRIVPVYDPKDVKKADAKP